MKASQITLAVKKDVSAIEFEAALEAFEDACVAWGRDDCDYSEVLDARGELIGVVIEARVIFKPPAPNTDSAVPNTDEAPE